MKHTSNLQREHKLIEATITTDVIAADKRNKFIFNLGDKFVHECLFIGDTPEAKALQGAVLKDKSFWDWYIFQYKECEKELLYVFLEYEEDGISIIKELTSDYYQILLSDYFIKEETMTYKFDAKFLGKYAKIVKSK